MDEYMRVNGWIYESMDEYMSQWMNEWINGWMNEPMDEWMNKWMNIWVNGWIYESMDEWMNQWLNEYTHTHTHTILTEVADSDAVNWPQAGEVILSGTELTEGFFLLSFCLLFFFSKTLEMFFILQSEVSHYYWYSFSNYLEQYKRFYWHNFLSLDDCKYAISSGMHFIWYLYSHTSLRQLYSKI